MQDAFPSSSVMLICVSFCINSMLKLCEEQTAFDESINLSYFQLVCCLCVRFTYNYEKARRQLDRAAETSTLETDQEKVSLLSRKNRKKKTVLSSDSAEESKVRKKSVPPASRKLVKSTARATCITANVNTINSK